MSLVEKNDLVYAITEEDIQCEAFEQIGRKLTDEEMATMKKQLEFGIGENMLHIWPALFDEFR
jgi:hypothetical protein